MMSLMPSEFKTIQPERVDEVDKVTKSQLKSRGRRWHEVTWPTEMPRQSLSRVIDEEGSYNLCSFERYSFFAVRFELLDEAPNSVCDN